MKIEGKTFIVSGGSSGLGLATVHWLVSNGAYAATLDVQDPLAAVPAGLADRHRFVQGDVAVLADIERAVDQTVEWTRATGARLGGVVCCAGVAGAAKIIGASGELHTTDLWDYIVAVNLTGSFNTARQVVKHLVDVEPEGPDGERGVVIFVSSASAYDGQPGQAAYGATKGALVSLALPLARDLARHHIRVVTVVPGVMNTPMMETIPQKSIASMQREVAFPPRWGEPGEFVQTVRWIVECPFVNGDAIRLSGGSRLPGRL